LSGSLTEAACRVLLTPDPADKIALTRAAAAAWRAAGTAMELGRERPPARPARPDRPILLPPRDMPKRRAGGSPAGRVALLHAIAHIELNAIDLAWDLIARFADAALPREFFDDWVRVAEEEAGHHALLAGRLQALGSRYGDLPAHDGLWQAATATEDDLLARLAIVPLVLEARGLDVTPDMIERLDRQGDSESAATLRVILRDEIGHVAAGRRWYEYECDRRGLEKISCYHTLVRARFRGGLKPPFNIPARDLAGFSSLFYLPLAAT
jgi:uncharacterized ferritin-like protein (DUF455 family)